MDLKQIKELMGAMEKTGTQRLRIKEEGYELMLERHDMRAREGEGPIPEYFKPEYRDDRFFQRTDAAFFKAGGAPIHHTTAHNRADTSSSQDGGTIVSEEMKAKKGEVIKSPMVGTFYMAPSPDDPPFIKIGDIVSADTVLCIIEAMKVMNEIKAGVKGRIVEVLVENNQPVEFGTPLFRIESKD